MHSSVHSPRAERGVMAAAVSRGEYRTQDYQRGQREGPETEVLAKRPESAFRTVGQIVYEITRDGQHGRRNEC
jgi:hypothetical protein